MSKQPAKRYQLKKVKELKEQYKKSLNQQEVQVKDILKEKLVLKNIPENLKGLQLIVYPSSNGTQRQGYVSSKCSIMDYHKEVDGCRKATNLAIQPHTEDAKMEKNREMLDSLENLAYSLEVAIDVEKDPILRPDRISQIKTLIATQKGLKENIAKWNETIKDNNSYMDAESQKVIKHLFDNIRKALALRLKSLKSQEPKDFVDLKTCALKSNVFNTLFNSLTTTNFSIPKVLEAQLYRNSGLKISIEELFTIDEKYYGHAVKNNQILKNIILENCFGGKTYDENCTNLDIDKTIEFLNLEIKTEGMNDEQKKQLVIRRFKETKVYGIPTLPTKLTAEDLGKFINTLPSSMAQKKTIERRKISKLDMVNSYLIDLFSCNSITFDFPSQKEYYAAVLGTGFDAEQSGRKFIDEFKAKFNDLNNFKSAIYDTTDAKLLTLVKATRGKVRSNSTTQTAILHDTAKLSCSATELIDFVPAVNTNNPVCVKLNKEEYLKKKKKKIQTSAKDAKKEIGNHIKTLASKGIALNLEFAQALSNVKSDMIKVKLLRILVKADEAFYLPIVNSYLTAKTLGSSLGISVEEENEEAFILEY